MRIVTWDSVPRASPAHPVKRAPLPEVAVSETRLPFAKIRCPVSWAITPFPTDVVLSTNPGIPTGRSNEIAKLLLALVS